MRVCARWQFVGLLTAMTLAIPARADEEPELKERLRQLEEQVRQLTEQHEQGELEKLVQEAEAEAKAPEAETGREQRDFIWGALALQRLNPEISFCADFLANLILDGDGNFYAGADDRSGLPVREVGLNFQHVLDPYSHFKSAINFHPGGGVELEEVYVSWHLIESLSVTLGRFRQQFGLLNRWHEHDLDQAFYPLALELVLGHGGLAGSGLSFKWFAPAVLADAQEVTLEITDGENTTLYAGEYFSVPTALLHLRNYYDLSDSTYLELGLTGAFGFHNRRGVPDEEAGRLRDESWRTTWVAGADLTLFWSPLQQAKYHSFTWRSEAYLAWKDRPEEAPEETRFSWGCYSYLQYQLAERWFVGLRYDRALPTVRFDDRQAWDVVAYATFWQSEFLYLRLEAHHGEMLPFELPDGLQARRVDNRILLQVDFAAGPHKHEKY